MPTKKPAKKKRKTSNSKPGHRSLAQCRQLGWRAQKVEYWLGPARKRIDLWGFGDVIALDGKPGSLLIQATSTSNAPARVMKILEECKDSAIDWLNAGNRVEVWGWGLRGARGKRKTWTLKRYSIELVNGQLTRKEPTPWQQTGGSQEQDESNSQKKGAKRKVQTSRSTTSKR